jgi:NhaC family Na+:H+ antiporter
LISGAMVGERFSPISSSRLLLIKSVGMEERTDLREHTPALVAVGLTALLYFLLDIGRENAAAFETIAAYQELLQRHFAVHWLQLIPLFVLIGSFAFRLKAVPALIAGIAASTVLVFATRPPDAGAFFHSILNGFDLQSHTKLDQLVHGGGMKAILAVLLLISLAGFMNGILNKANALTPIVDRLMGNTQNLRVLAGKAVALSLVVVVISCNQTIPILVLGSTLLGRFSQLREGKQLLRRTMLDSTLVMPVLIPWNGLAMVMSVTLGVPTLEALPYMFFSLLLPILTVLSVRQHAPAGSLIQEKQEVIS